MKKEVYLTILFDYYSELLNEKQKKYFTSYYFDNLSLGEIAENLNISRNAIHKQLKSIEEKLYFYENTLKLYDKENKLKEIINNITDINIKKALEEILNKE